MEKEDLKKSTCINLRCVTQSSKGGVPLNQLQNDYRQLLGTPIPFKDLGYSSLENFLRDIPDVICLKKNPDGSLIVEGVADASTAHIAKLISKQKPSKKSKLGSLKPAVVTRTWGSSGKTNSYLKLKTPLKDSNSFPHSNLYREHENKKFIQLTPAQQELKKSVLVNLRSVVQSCKDGVPLNRLQNDYRKFIGSNIPFQNLGYNTLYKFIQSIPDVIKLKMDMNEQFIAIGVVDEATAHLFGNSVKPKPSKSVSSPNESSANHKPTLQICSEKKAESSFFKLPQNTMELSDINSVLKHIPTQKKVRKKTQPVYSVSEMISKNKMKHASKEDLIKVEHLKASIPVISSNENSAPEVSLSKTDIDSSQNPKKIAKTIHDQIRVASLSPLVWMNFILYGPTKIKTLRKKALSFCGFPFSTDSKEWKEKMSVLSQLPKEVLHQCLYLLRIEYDLKDSKKALQDKLINFLAAFTEESGTKAQETEEKDSEKELHASTLTLSSISSDVSSKCSYFVDAETSDTMLSDRSFASETKHKIVSDLMKSLVDRQNLLRKSSPPLEETKKPIQTEQSNDEKNFQVKKCEGIQSEKSCKTKHSTKSASPKPSVAGKTTSVVQKQQSLDKDVGEQKVDTEECSKANTSSLVISKSAKRRRKRKKAEDAQKNIGMPVTKPVKVRMPGWQVQQMIKLKKEKREKKSLLSSVCAVEAKTATSN